MRGLPTSSGRRFLGPRGPLGRTEAGAGEGRAEGEVWCSVVMRVASSRDEAVLAQLAALDSQQTAVAPFRPALLVIEQLEQRMNQLQDKVA